MSDINISLIAADLPAPVAPAINKAGVTKLEEMRKQILTKYNESHNCKKTWFSDALPSRP